MLMGVDMTGFLADRHAKLRNVSTSAVSTDSPTPDVPEVAGPSDGDVELLPWHRNPVNLVAYMKRPQQ
jgi:hypothetical protein